MSEVHESQPPSDGVVAVIRHGGRYLVIQRAAHLAAGGMWCFVGGAVEPGETQAEAVVREVAEEVGMVAEPIAKVWQCPSWNGRWLLHCWLVQPRGTAVRPNPAEVADYRWLSEPELRRLPDVMPSVLDYLDQAGGG